MPMPKAYMQSGKQPGNLLRFVKCEDFLWKCPNEGVEPGENVQGVVLCIYCFFSIFLSFEIAAAVTKGFLSSDLHELS